MTRIDLSPFRAMTVGFDSLFNDIADFRPSSYPPYNIEKVGDCEYKLTFAVAGFSEKDISVTQKENTLAIEGELSPPITSIAIFIGLIIGGFYLCNKGHH